MNTWNRKLSWSVVASVLVLAGATGPTHAAKQKDPAKEALRRVQVEMKKVQDDIKKVQEEKALIDIELEVTKKKTGSLEAAAARAERRRTALDKEATSLRQDKVTLAGKTVQLEQVLAEEKKSLSETRVRLDQETGKRQGLEQMLSTRDKELGSCETKNRTLYRYQVDLIKHAQARGTLHAILDSEPFTGLGRIEVENLLEEYRDKVEAEKIVPVPGTRTSVTP